MTALPPKSLTPETLDQLVEMLGRLKEQAIHTLKEYDLTGGVRDSRRDYHDGRADAYDVALFYATELRRVQGRKH